jgi:hypothetical protein
VWAGYFLGPFGQLGTGMDIAISMDILKQNRIKD